MTYYNELPHTNKISRLASLIEYFTATSSDVLKTARSHKFSKSMQNFIELFPENAVFVSVDDFLNFSKDLETVIREERNTQQETSISP